jgi:hypothetical protein
VTEPASTDKRCAWCGNTKPLWAFSRDRGQTDGLDRACKTCRSYSQAKRKGRLITGPKKRALWFDWTQRTALAGALADRVEAKSLNADPASEEGRWLQCFRLIATGTRTHIARQRAGIQAWQWRQYLRAEPRLQKFFAHVRKSAKRRNFSMLDIEDALDEIRSSDVGMTEALMKRGYSRSRVKSFFTMKERDPELRAQYDGAKWCQRQYLLSRAEAAMDGVTTRSAMKGFKKQLHRIETLRPVRDKRAEAAARREATESPLMARIRQARAAAKRATSKAAHR